MYRIIQFIVLIIFITPFAKADEGMWIPLLLEKYNLSDMQRKGLKLTAEDIYSINQPSIKDAIVMFGRGCTGSLISPNGLVITNHHCGYGVIQRLSSIENDYLTNGFWAMSKEEELKSPGLTVTFLIRIEDVTEKVLEGVSSGISEFIREANIQIKSQSIIDSVTADNHYTARVAPFFYGNQYFLFVYETFSDVRLVGAPPSDIGKFGGDTDNWMWPRHTGDFALFRIYADKNNNPAPYSIDNVPYIPKKYLPISLKGVEPGDFTMVYGYPGTTEQYITSQAVDQVVNISNPLKISLRDVRLNIMESYMKQNDTVRIKYSNKQAGVANAWKKWIGERKGLIRLNAIEKKRIQEDQFADWVNQSPQRIEEYGQILQRFAELYQQREMHLLADDLRREVLSAIEINRFALRFQQLIQEFETGGEPDLAKVENLRSELIAETRAFYKDYYLPIDMEVFTALMKFFVDRVPLELKPKSLIQLIEQKNGDWDKITSTYFAESIFTDSTKLIYYLTHFNKLASNKFKDDLVYRMNVQFDSIFYENVSVPFQLIKMELDILYRSYMKGLMAMQTEKVFYPDANFTLRLSYGNVEGYSPNDAVEYLYKTTLDGIIHKTQLDVYDYKAPQRMLDLHSVKDYGRWEVNGTVPVAFIATNHTSGGNSGSPVIDGEGNLIGVNFDRVWEGTMSDIMYDPAMCRNISLDIRFALFVIDKFAGAGHLLNEMALIQ
jgi:hypothetical protein